MKYYMYTDAGNTAASKMVNAVVAVTVCDTTDSAAVVFVAMRETINETHPEIFDTVVRETMWKQIVNDIGEDRAVVLAEMDAALMGY